MNDSAIRKLHFIEKYLRINDEDLINRLEAVLQEGKQAAGPQDTSHKPSVNDFVGVLDEKEAKQMKKDIETADLK